ncbi:unnamed protein product, partial [marine sediment metagenome]
GICRIRPFLNIRDLVANARSQFDGALPEARQILPEVLTIADASQNGRGQLLAKLNQAAATGILPSGFAGFADALIQSFQSPVQDRVGPLTQALQAANNELQNHAAYTAQLNQTAAFLQAIFVTPSAFNPAAIGFLPGDPKLSVGGGATQAGHKPGIMDIASNENSEITFAYDVGKSSTAYAAAAVEFPSGPAALPENIVLSFKGPAGALLKVVFTDADGNQAEFFLELSPDFSNFNLSFSGNHIPPGFDRTQITKMEFMLDQVLAGTKNRRGKLSMRTNGNDFAAVYAGLRAVRYKTKTNASGQLTSFEERVFDQAGNLLYSLKRTGIRRHKLTGEIIAYSDTYKLPDKSSFKGMYKDGLYKLTGNANLPSGKQKIQHYYQLGPEDTFVLDPARTQNQRNGNILMGGFGALTVVGDFQVIRYYTAADKYGNETGFEERIFDQAGNLLYALKRTGIRRDKATGVITRYTDTYKLPDKSSFKGMYKDGLYKLSGNANLPSGKQK